MHHNINRYWRACEERGEKPRPVFALISTGGEQPEGYCISWTVNRRAAEKDLAKRNPAHWRLMKVSPC